MTNFDLKKFLVENKLTSNSKNISEEGNRFSPWGEWISPFDVDIYSIKPKEGTKAGIVSANWKDGTPLTDEELGKLMNYPNIMWFYHYYLNKSVDDFIKDYSKKDKLLKEPKTKNKEVEFDGQSGTFLMNVGEVKVYSLEDSNVYDTMFYGLVTADGQEVISIEVGGETVDAESLQSNYNLSPNLAAALANDINNELEG